jgi:chromosome transmission fidelity protein 18
MAMKALQESTESLDHEACSVTQVTEQLWVEKYAPNSFTELLSDEHTNREVNSSAVTIIILFH